MRSFLFFTLIASLISNISFAAIRRVGYTGTALAGVDYPNLAAAQGASDPGDTIQVYGTIAGADINKPLVIMGFGYNFDVNTGLQAVGNDAPSTISGTLSFQPGSQGSSLEGCFLSIVSSFSQNMKLFTSNITIKRCYIKYPVELHNEVGPINDIKIISCVVEGGGGQGIFMNRSDINPCQNFQVYNCILSSVLNFYLPGSSGSVINCVTSVYGFQLFLNTAAFLVKNCVLMYYNDTNSSTIYENNFFGAAQPPILPVGNNRWNQSWANLFTRIGTNNNNIGGPGFPEFDEDYYALLAGSPAINGGFDNLNNPTDCGIYGGEAAYRYKLSGVPAVPAIYKLSAPASATSGNPYNVTISVRSNN